VAGKKVSAADTVLLKALGITPQDLAVREEDMAQFREFFDSPLREQHVRAIASIFGKVMPESFDQEAVCQLAVSVQ
jgi:hypothetical protein